MSSAIDRLTSIMARLRDPQTGCPWDVAQTFQSIAPCTIEEAYEVVDAIEKGDMPHFKEELGDLLLQVVFHARMAEESNLFDLDAVADGLSDKLVRRHPHIFGDDKVETAEEMTQKWEAQKAEERAKAAPDGQPVSALDDVLTNLPALTRAYKLQKRAARVGFDWINPHDVLDKIIEEVEEVKAEMAVADPARLCDEVGDLLFAVTNLARQVNLDPEATLRQANAKFERRFRRMEQLATDRNTPFPSLSLPDQEALWDAVKKEEKQSDKK